MMKTLRVKDDSFTQRKLSLRKAVKYISFIIGGAVLFCVLMFILFPDPFINTLLKDQITKAFTEAYPEYTIELGDMHYSVWKNQLGCDTITLDAGDSTFTSSVASFSVYGIPWIKILWQGQFTLNNLTSSTIDAQNIVFNLRQTQDEFSLGMLHISVPDSEIVADSIKYYSLISDEQFFSKSQFKQTRFRFDIPQIKIMGLDYPALLQGNTYNAKSINIYNMFADILVNMDKPYDKNSSKPQMPNEALFLMKEIVKIDSLKIINGRLKYGERFAIGATPGVILFNKVNVLASGISNHQAHPDTVVIHVEGLFMNSGRMKLFMEIPLASRDFSLRYSGSLSAMDMTELNSFIEPAEHHRIKSGIVQSATYNINVNTGNANGTLRVVYKDLSIAVIDKNTGSEKGFLDKISSFISKSFVIRGNNMPDKSGLMKIGVVGYTRKPVETFIQFMWFALRSGIGNVVGF